MQSVLLIDNFDSFTFNLVDAIRQLGIGVHVLRNTVAASEAMAAAQSNRASLVLSPGPGRPEDAGCCMALIELARAQVPLLGVCLGHQALVHASGGKICSAPVPVHGKTTVLHHDGTGPFAGIEGPIQVGRYHSLGTHEVPERFRVHAEIDGMAMAISDAKAMQTGLQFHPESILTPLGRQLLRNILLGSG